jgi:hypothetical protein
LKQEALAMEIIVISAIVIYAIANIAIAIAVARVCDLEGRKNAENSRF